MKWWKKKRINAIQLLKHGHFCGTQKSELSRSHALRNSEFFLDSQNWNEETEVKIEMSIFVS